MSAAAFVTKYVLFDIMYHLLITTVLARGCTAHNNIEYPCISSRAMPSLNRSAKLMLITLAWRMAATQQS